MTTNKKNPRIAAIAMRYENKAWTWSFFSTPWGSCGGYHVHSCGTNTHAPTAIRHATRVAKLNGFDDAKVRYITIIER